MPGLGMLRSLARALANAMARQVAWIVAAACILPPGLGVAEGLVQPLTGEAGDPLRGRAIVADQYKGLCVLCHAGPFPEHRFMGTLAPTLEGVGARLTVPELRARMVDSRTVNPETIMPPYFASDGLNRIGPDWMDQTILTAQEVEDVVAYLATLTEEPQ